MEENTMQITKLVYFTLNPLESRDKPKEGCKDR